jgi:uridine kinase
LADIQTSHPLRVAIDGIDAAGKTVFANDLAPLVNGTGRSAIRASIDGFHRPRNERLRRGADSPEGYYLDSYDYDTLIRVLLKPLGAKGDLVHRTAVFDFRTEQTLDLTCQKAHQQSVLLFDGIFLFRPELNQYWDYRIFLDISFETCLERALTRDGHLFGSEEMIRERYSSRYIPGQRVYLDKVKPYKIADLVIDNNDFLNPRVSGLPRE